MQRNLFRWAGRAVMGLGLGAMTVAGLSTTPASADMSSCGEIVRAYISRYGGVQIGADEVAFQSGAVVMDLGCAEALNAAVEAADFAGKTVEGCPSGWYCFYEHFDFNEHNKGRKLQFRDCANYGLTQSLRNYGFHDATSSWVNNKGGAYVTVWDNHNWPDAGETHLWTEDPHSRSSWVGWTVNDRADFFECSN